MDCGCPSTKEVKTQFNYDGDIKDLHINFSSKFDPWHTEHLGLNVSGRKDLIYGKVFLLRQFIEQNILDKYEYMCHIDYSDTKFCKSYIEMMENFIASGEDFIISTEKNCWPYLGIVKNWVDYPVEEKEFYYVNSGAVIAKTHIYHEYLVQLEQICLSINTNFWDDQGLWQYHHLKIKPLNTDNTCKYFFSTAMLDESYYSMENGFVKTKFNTYPYLIHDNSSFSLNLRNKI